MRSAAAKRVPFLTVREIQSVGVEVPMTVPLGTRRGAITKAAFLLIDLKTEEGITGRAYLFCYVREAAFAVAKFLEEVKWSV